MKMNAKYIVKHKIKINCKSGMTVKHGYFITALLL